MNALRPTERFTDRAADYVKYRPGYPPAVAGAILAGMGDPSSLLVADVGAGTGISSRLLADGGARVLAVEPNAAMRSAAAPHARVEWREGAAEATGLGPGSVDIVAAAQAFHWFHIEPALSEFHRILKSGGRLALFWNSRDRDDGLTRGYIEAIRAVGGEGPEEERSFDPERIGRSGLFATPRLATFAHEQELSLEGLIGRATSASYCPREGPAFQDLSRRLEALFATHSGAGAQVRMKYVTQVYLSPRLEGPGGI